MAKSAAKSKKKEDKRDPICGMQGHIKAHGHYFCSQHCIEKYEKQEHIHNCPSCSIKGGHLPWYKERLYVVVILTLLILAISYFVPGLNKLYVSFIDYFRLIWWAVLLGIVIGGIIDYYVPNEYISHALSSRKRVSIFYAVGLGFLMSACSHGILAIAIQLYKKGASVPAVVAFLLASPWANLPITILMFGFFGAKAFLLIFGAIIIALVTGFIFIILDRKRLIERNPNTVNVKKGFDIRNDIRQRFRNHRFSVKKDVYGVLKGSWALTKMVAWWILLGMIIAALARAFIPQMFFMKYMGPTVLGLLVTLVLATLIEVCSEGSSVLAFEIFTQTGAFGNSFAFLLAGVATDYTEIGLLWSNVGRKTALWLPIVTVPQIIVLSLLFNALL